MVERRRDGLGGIVAIACARGRTIAIAGAASVDIGVMAVGSNVFADTGVAGCPPSSAQHGRTAGVVPRAA